MTAIRPVTAADLDAVRRLNAANVPAVGPLDEDRLALFTTEAEAFWVAADDGGGVVALFVGLLAGHDYASPNYRWFGQRRRHFAYVDRVAIAPQARGTGLADDLYDQWEAVAIAAGAPVVCAEVNIRPPNPRSMSFHQRRGFVPVDELAPYGDDQRVAMLEKEL